MKIKRSRTVLRLLTKEEMENLDTRRLLAYKNALLTFHESEEGWIVHGELGKDSPYWQETYKNVKNILSTREHVK